jgi:hypothetical protein
VSTEPASQQGEELSQDRWAPYFEDLNRRVEGGETLDATIELESDELYGPEVEHLPLNGITHEDGDDQIAVGVGGRGRRFPSVLWHFVDHPRRVWVHEQDETTAILVESQDGTRTIVTLHRTRGE